MKKILYAIDGRFGNKILKPHKKDMDALGDSDKTRARQKKEKEA